MTAHLSAAVVAPPLSRGAPLLSVHNLRVPGKLHDVNLSLMKGEILGIIGRAGCGRSTLLKALMGSIRTAESRMEFDGEDYQPRGAMDAIRRGVFRVPEDRRLEGLLLSHSVSLNMVLAGLNKLRRFLAFDRSAARSHSFRLLRELGIRAGSINDAASSLSGGNQQKILMARALFADSRVLLFDEPTVGVDVGAAREIVRLAREYVDAGNGVVWVSSDLTEVGRVADRILVLGDGVVLYEVLNAEHDMSEAALVGVLEKSGSELVDTPVTSHGTWEMDRK